MEKSITIYFSDTTTSSVLSFDVQSDCTNIQVVTFAEKCSTIVGYSAYEVKITEERTIEIE